MGCLIEITVESSWKITSCISERSAATVCRLCGHIIYFPVSSFVWILHTNNHEIGVAFSQSYSQNNGGIFETPVINGRTLNVARMFSEGKATRIHIRVIGCGQILQGLGVVLRCVVSLWRWYGSAFAVWQLVKNTVNNIHGIVFAIYAILINMQQLLILILMNYLSISPTTDKVESSLNLHSY